MVLSALRNCSPRFVRLHHVILSVRRTCLCEVTSRDTLSTSHALTSLYDPATSLFQVEAVFDVSWGGVSMLNAELAMAQGLLEMGDWDYWINLSSTDYPLKPGALVPEFLDPSHRTRAAMFLMCRLHYT